MHLDHGYCSTVHAAQGRTCDRVLIDADTKSLTSAEDNYYVAISRAKYQAKIYTDEARELPGAMSQENPKKAALEVHLNDEALQKKRQQWRERSFQPAKPQLSRAPARRVGPVAQRALPKKLERNVSRPSLEKGGPIKNKEMELER